MCYIFRQICPFHSELRKDKIATCLLLPPAFFLSPPTFWEARDQPEPGSFFPRMKDPGNEVGKLVGRLTTLPPEAIQEYVGGKLLIVLLLPQLFVTGTQGNYTIKLRPSWESRGRATPQTPHHPTPTVACMCVAETLCKLTIPLYLTACKRLKFSVSREKF